MAGLVHIAGLEISVGPLLRQRCGWCGTTLLHYDLRRTASMCDERCRTDGCKPEHHRPATWPPGELVEVDGNASWAFTHEDGEPLPDNACALLDAAVTV